MPEEVEIESERIDEQIKEQLEREGGSLLKAIALTTALFAALAAVAALRAGGTVNEALVLKPKPRACRLKHPISGPLIRQKVSSRRFSRRLNHRGWLKANSLPLPFPRNASATPANRQT